MYLEMGTTGRHNNLLSELYRKLVQNIEDLIIYKSAIIFLEQIGLCYSGRINEFHSLSLLEPCSTLNVNLFNVVYPDLMLFKNNTYITNTEQTRFLGKPDLIVEVWSNSNSKLDRDFKKHLYSTSPITEHWYLEQTSNTLKCWLGDVELQSQDLRNELKTSDGLKIDLRHLAL